MHRPKKRLCWARTHTDSHARPLGRSHTMMNKGVSRTVHIIVVNGLKTRSFSIKCINLFAMENGAKVKIKIWANIIFRIEWTVSCYYMFTKEENEGKNCEQNGDERSQWSQAVQHRKAGDRPSKKVYYTYTQRKHGMCGYLCVVIIFFRAEKNSQNHLVFWIWIKLEIGSDFVRNSDCRRWQSIWFGFLSLFLILSDSAFKFRISGIYIWSSKILHICDQPDFACKSIGRCII